MTTGILTQLFGNLNTFLSYAPGADTSVDLDALNASAIAARKRIISVITEQVYTAIVTAHNGAAFESVLTAIANLTLANQLIFDTVYRKKSETNIYKYEVEAMKRGYMENFFNAMDTLLQELSASPSGEVEENSKSAPSLWKNTRYYSILQSCKIPTAEEFDALYPIDLSYLFFFRTIPLQRESLNERIGSYFSRITEDNEESVTPLLLLALAKKTVAKALRRFDILEFPPTLRNLFDSNTATRSGKDEHSQAIALAAQLDAEADELLSTADAMLTDNSQSDFSTVTSFNRPDDKIISLP